MLRDHPEIEHQKADQITAQAVRDSEHYSVIIDSFQYREMEKRTMSKLPLRERLMYVPLHDIINCTLIRIIFKCRTRGTCASWWLLLPCASHTEARRRYRVDRAMVAGECLCFRDTHTGAWTSLLCPGKGPGWLIMDGSRYQTQDSRMLLIIFFDSRSLKLLNL